MADPHRIVVLGCSGAGKSTLARRLAEQTGLPAIHLDQHFWQAGWTPRDKGDFTEKAAALTEGNRWIIDGNYINSGNLDARLRRAEVAVLLDLPRWLCLLRVFQRAVRSHGIVREDMAPGCPEKIDWPFLRYIWNWHRRSRPRIIAALREFQGPVAVLSTPRAVRSFLADPRSLRAETHLG